MNNEFTIPNGTGSYFFHGLRKELRKTCGLKEIPVNDGLQATPGDGDDADF
jgi:hypothetical protein